MKVPYSRLSDIFKFEHFFINKNLTKSENVNRDYKKFNLYKIPYYFETNIYYTSLMAINSVLFNIIKLPLRVMYLNLKYLFSSSLTKEETKLLFYYSLKVFLLILSFMIYDYIQSSLSIYNDVENFIDSIKDAKLYSYMKIFEFLCLLANRFNDIIDIDLVSIVFSSNISYQVFTFLTTFAGFLFNLTIIQILTLAYKKIIFSNTNMVYLLFISIFSIDIKSRNKRQNKKKIIRLLNKDIFDRWLFYYCLFITFTNGMIDGEINHDNLGFFSILFLYLTLMECLFKWIKNIVLIKVSGTGDTAEVISLLTNEYTVLYISTKYHYLEEDEKEMGKYSIEEQDIFRRVFAFKYQQITHENNNLIMKYTHIIDYENLICIEMELGTLLYVYLLLKYIFTFMSKFSIAVIVFLLFITFILSHYLVIFIEDEITCRCFRFMKGLLEKKGSRKDLIFQTNVSNNSSTQQRKFTN